MLYATDRWYLRWLEPLGDMYRGAARARRRAYEEGRRPRRKLPRPVISVGNLTVGGTGKTPLVMYLCEKLAGWCHPAVLTRGYGRRGKRDYVTLPDPRQLDERAALFFGDEPVMMARRLARTSIHLGPNRYKTGLRALGCSAVDVFILDDGFQHIELARDLDIVILDGTEDVRRLHALPAGPLREPVESLSRADIVLINHCAPDGSHRIDRDWLRGLCPDAPVVRSRYTVESLINARSGEELKPEQLREFPLFAFCGIAQPGHFRDTLKELALTLAGSRSFGDHHVLGKREYQELSRLAQESGARGFITTEKDATRLNTALLDPLPVYYPRLKLMILEGEEQMWERIGEVLNVG